MSVDFIWYGATCITGGWFCMSLIIHCMNPLKSRRVWRVWAVQPGPYSRADLLTVKKQHLLVMTVGYSLLQLQDRAGPLHALFSGSLSSQGDEEIIRCNGSISNNSPHSGKSLLYRLGVQKRYILSWRYLTSMKLVRDTGCFDAVGRGNTASRVEEKVNTFFPVCSVPSSF